MTTPDDFQSITGALESAEPSTTPTQQAPASTTSTTTKTRSGSVIGPDTASTAAMKHPTKLPGARSLNVAGSPSPNSPVSSRDASPARPHQRAVAPTAASSSRSGLRSRKNSIDVSPQRAASPATSSRSPSAAAIQRSQSSTSIPALPADSIKAPRPLKPSSGPNSGDSTPHWPISPRLRSPPPTGADGRSGSRSRANSLRTQLRKQDAQSNPAIVVQSSSPASVSRIPVREAREEAVASDPDEPVMSLKGPSRGASGAAPKLETVQESSLPPTPGFDGLEGDSFLSTSTSTSTTTGTSEEERNDVSHSKVTEDLSSNLDSSSRTTGSGSDSGSKAAKKGKMQEQRSASTARPHQLNSKQSLSALSTRSATQPPLRNMTVETETIPSVAQSAIGNQDRSASGRTDGSLRLKPSNETIRPKKKREPAKRKAPSINAGTASSKADVFEQKVASAVDEADSSDSDATFIYESNPPEPPHRSRQHHSRTPSMTSIASLADPRLAIRDTHNHPNKKSSMKFTNPSYNPGADADAVDRGDGTVRIGSGRAGGGSHHHHINRHGQGRGTLNHLVLDSDSSLAQSSRARGPSSRQASQPNSPRFHTFAVGNGHSNGNKKHGEYSVYDMDAEHAADDERTPLIQSGRSPRVRTPRRRNSLTVRGERRHHHGNGNGWCRRIAAFLVLAVLLLVVVFSAVGLVFATTKPLTDITVSSLQNVVISEDEIIMDVVLYAINPNIIGVTIADMDISVFAKSKHVGSDRWWRQHGHNHSDEEVWKPVDDDFAIEGGIDEGTDPIDEPFTMTLGHVSHFDSPLNFDGSFFARRNTSSVGEMRLPHPANHTEGGGNDRWEDTLEHPFDLIIRGNFKYQLPLSTREQKFSVTASYHYNPDAEKKDLSIAAEDPSSHTVLPKTLGRYDRRALPLLKME